MRYTVITGLYPGSPGYDVAHYIFTNSHPQIIPSIWNTPIIHTTPHGIHHVYYFRKW